LKLIRNGVALLLAVHFPGAIGEIKFDGTFGRTDTLTGDMLIEESAGGLNASGTNLFHSFTTFNVLKGESATFTFSTATVENIIGRVTGADGSIIDGRISSDANLWIANPNGVLIGESAIFDGNGIVQVNAADTIFFGNGDEFRVRDTNPGASLSIASPDSFGFVSIRTDTSLGGSAETLLDSVDGSANLDESLGRKSGANLFFSFDRFSIYPKQEVNITDPGIENVVARVTDRESTLFNGRLTQSFSDPGDSKANLWFINPNGLAIGRNAELQLTNSLVLASTEDILFEDNKGFLDAVNGSALPISPLISTANGYVEFQNANIIAPGDVAIVAGNIVRLNDSTIDTTSPGDAKSGGIILESVNTVEMISSTLVSNSLGDGDGGLIEVRADEVSTKNSRITSAAFGTGNAGSIDIHASAVQMADTTLSSDAFPFLSPILIDDVVKSFELALETDLSATSIEEFVEEIQPILERRFNIELTATTIAELSGQLAVGLSQVDVDSLGLPFATTDLTRLRQELGGSGIAGFINISADDIAISSSFVSTETISAGETSILGAIVISSGNDLTLDSTQITASTLGSADAGDIILLGEEINIADSFLVSNSSGAGNAGSIRISASDNLQWSGGLITSDAFISNFVTADVAKQAFESGFQTRLEATNADELVWEIQPFLESSLGIQLASANASQLSQQILTSTEERRGNLDNLLGSFSLNSLSFLVDEIPESGAAGKVELTGTRLDFKNGSISTDTNAKAHDGESGSINLLFTEVVSLNGSGVSASTYNAAPGGNIYLMAPSILVQNSNLTSKSFSAGNAGTVILRSSQDIEILENSSITTGTSSSGAAGDIVMDTVSFRMDSGLISSSSNVEVTLLTDAITAFENAFDTDLQALTREQFAFEIQPLLSNALGVELSATDLTELQVQLNHLAFEKLNQIDELLSDSVSIYKLDEIVAELPTTGSAGTIDILASDFHMEAGTLLTNSFATSELSLPATITLQALNDLDIINSQITADTNAQSVAGDIYVAASLINLSQTNIFAESLGEATGNAGNVRISGVDILLDGANVGSRALSAEAMSGTIQLLADQFIEIDGNTSVTTSTLGSGTAGNIDVLADSVDIIDSSVSSQSFGTGPSGSIVFSIQSLVELTRSEVTTNAESSRGGDIFIETKDSTILLDFGRIAASAGANGDGGNIFLETDLLVLDNSNVLAQAAGGNGGFINIDGILLQPADGLRSQITVMQDFNSLINADSETGSAGVVNIEAPSSDISAVVSQQDADTLAVPRLASDRCSDISSGDSRLTRRASGAIRTNPDSHNSVVAQPSVAGSRDQAALIRPIPETGCSPFLPGGSHEG